MKFKVYKRYSSDIWFALLNGRNLNMAFRLSLIMRRVRVLSRDRENRDLFNLISFGRKPVRFRSRRAPRFSMYRIQLFSRKQVQFFYQIYKSRQVRAIFGRISRFRGSVEDSFFGSLESRICTLVFRAGWFVTMVQARQYILHRGLLVNGSYTNRPGYTVGYGDVVSFLDCDFLANLRTLPISIPNFRPALYFSKILTLRRRRLGVNGYRHVGFPSSYMEVSYVCGSIVLFSRPMFSSIFYPFEFSPSDLISFYS